MKIKYVMQAAIIAAIYAVITIVLSPISYGPMQIRVSEALTILPVFTSAGIPGLFVGCIISNLMGPYGLVDIVCGSAATLIAAFFTYKLKNKPVLAPLPPVIANGIIIGAELHYAYGVPGLWACMGWVALGELLACYALGFPLIKLLQKYKGIFR